MSERDKNYRGIFVWYSVFVFWAAVLANRFIFKEEYQKEMLGGFLFYIGFILTEFLSVLIPHIIRRVKETLNWRKDFLDRHNFTNIKCESDDIFGYRYVDYNEPEPKSEKESEEETYRERMKDHSNNFREHFVSQQSSRYVAVCKVLHEQNYYIWRSKKYHTGKDVNPEYYLLGINTQQGEQVTIHVGIMSWFETDFADTLDKAIPHDGHHYNDAVRRLAKIVQDISKFKEYKEEEKQKGIVDITEEI